MKEKHSKIEAYLIEQAVTDKNGEQKKFWYSPVYSSHKAAILVVEFGNPLRPESCGSFFILGEMKGQLDVINKAIEKLPKKCKEIFLLSKKEGYTNMEISEILTISIKTVESQMTIAFKQLKKQTDFYIF